MLIHLYYLFHKPGDVLQVCFLQVGNKGGLQGTIVWSWQLHRGKQVRDDTLKQRDVLLQELQSFSGEKDKLQRYMILLRQCNNGLYTFGRLTSLMDLSSSTSSSCSGYFNLRLPAAVKTDLTALMP